jgi:hypothetical protein
MTTDQSLQKLFSKRAWHKNSGIRESTARIYKKRFLDNKLEMETKIRILKTFGFNLVQDMNWKENINPKQIRRDLLKKLQQVNAFWYYDPLAVSGISDDIVIEKVLEYLDIEEIRQLFQIYTSKEIKRVWKDKMLRQEPMFHNLNRLYAFLLFDIKDPDRYIRNYSRSHNESIHTGTD